MKRFLLLSVAAMSLLFSGCVEGPTKCDAKAHKSELRAERKAKREAKAIAKAEAESYTITNAEQAMAALVEGNERYAKGKIKSPRTGVVRRESTVNSQYPFAAVVACSDSRVPVEQIFDQGIGDLFVIRTAGNNVSSDIMMGSVDYAIDHLEVPLVVVLGHQNCGGVTSAITVAGDYGFATEEHQHNGKIGELIEIIREDVEDYVEKPKLLNEAVRHNAKVQAERIRDRKYVQELIKSGKLKVVSAYYNLESGKVEFDAE